MCSKSRLCSLRSSAGWWLAVDQSELHGIKLTDEQFDAATTGDSIHVQACPGAGKTRTVLALAIERSLGLTPTQGLAVLSFTRAAADEFADRMVEAGRPKLARFPNFVGTVDGFICRYLVTPFGIRADGQKRPHIIDSHW